jgi:hypothetical protein
MKTQAQIELSILVMCHAMNCHAMFTVTRGFPSITIRFDDIQSLLSFRSSIDDLVTYEPIKGIGVQFEQTILV